MKAKTNMTMLCDFYELTMGNGYFQTGLTDRICYFDVFYRSVPDQGGFAIAAGLAQVVEYIENLHFDEEDIAYLRSKDCFAEEFLDYLKNFSFTGDIWAVPEGTPIFPGEPILTVRAPAIQAQFIETFVLLCLNHQCLIATKSNRIVRAAEGRPVAEFGSRRAHGPDGALLGARASYIAGCVQVYDESGEYGTLVGYNGTQTFAPSVFSQQNVITFTETDSEGERTQQRVSFIYTDRGIRFFEPTVVNGVTCDEFTWDNATKTFTSTADANVRLKYERPADYLPIEFYTEHEWEASYNCDFGMNDTTEAVTFTRVEDTDTLLTHFTALNMSYEVKAIYNPTTGMIEFRTQFLDRVTLITTDNKQVNAYVHLCPWNEFDGTVYLANNAGIVSYTSQMEPRVLEFADNGRMSGSDFNGFVFLAFDGPERTSNQLGALGTFSEIKLRQIVEEDTEE